MDFKSAAEQQVRKERDEIHAKYPHWALRDVYTEIAVSKTAELMEMTSQRDEAQKALEKWSCFHCGFTTSDTAEAEAHFGDHDDVEPACKTWASLDADGKLSEYQGVLRELNATRRENEALRISNEGLEYRTHAEEMTIRQYKPFKECRTINDVFFLFDSMEGRAESIREQAERIRGLERTISDHLKVEASNISDEGEDLLRRALRGTL